MTIDNKHSSPDHLNEQVNSSILQPMWANKLIDATNPCVLCGSLGAILISQKCRYREPLRTVLCLSCGLGRRDPMPDENELQAYYHDVYRVELGYGRQPSKGRLWRGASLAVERAQDLIPRISMPCITVDVGCGAGELVYMMTALGHTSQGFDPDSNYIQWSRQLLGLKVEACGIKDINIGQGSRDLVTMYHVLEHLPDPGAALARCAEWLNEGGLLVIEVPNIESTLHGPGHQYQKGHLHYFNQQTLIVLASQSSLRMESCRLVYGGENVRCYFRKDMQLEPIARCIPDNAERILNILELHTKWKHYSSSIPYRRALNRLTRTIVETVYSYAASDAAILWQHALRLL